MTKSRAYYYDGDDRDDWRPQGCSVVGWYYIDAIGVAIGPYESREDAERACDLEVTND